MTRVPCPRLWQVEAARDGRLTGSDLSSALRHRTECADCGQEARALAELGQQIEAVQTQPVDPLRQRRTRQALLGAWNEHLLAEREPRARRRSALIAASCVVGAVALAALYPRARPALTNAEHPRPPFEVVAKPGTRWHVLEAPNSLRLALDEGVASFTIRRPSGQRAFVDLPDGQIEDLGTVFEVEVQGQRTRRIAVSAGRVFVRLKAQPEFELNAGQSWSAEPSQKIAAVPQATAEASAGSNAVARAPAMKSRDAQPQPPRTAARATLDTAEDDAYLHIVDLLRNGHPLEARAKAKQYLVLFPNGFRRNEVFEIANR